MIGVRRRFSEELKRGVVLEIESGQLSIREAAHETQAGVSQVKNWLEEYGRYKPKRDILEVVMKSEQERVKELEKALADAHLKLRLYEDLIEVASKRYKVDLKKNIGTLSSGGAVEVGKAGVSEAVAKRSGSAVTRTTKSSGGGGRSTSTRRK